MSDNPMDDIESDKALGDLGALGLTTYRGVIAAGGTSAEAFDVLAAYFAGLFKANASPPVDPSAEK
jgi:hypothetical protein